MRFPQIKYVIFPITKEVKVLNCNISNEIMSTAQQVCLICKDVTSKFNSYGE